MDNNNIPIAQGGMSMRRTFLTLLGGFAAFAILTASYATADLPEPAAQTEIPVASLD